MQVGDRVKIKKSIDDSNLIPLKFIGQISTIIGIRENIAPPIEVIFDSQETEAFWPEELKKVK